MKQILKTIVAAVMLVAMVSCGNGGQINIQRVEQICMKGDNITKADYDELIDIYEALMKKYSHYDTDDIVEMLENNEEVQTIYALTLLFGMSDGLTDAQEDRVEQIIDKYDVDF